MEKKTMTEKIISKRTFAQDNQVLPTSSVKTTMPKVQPAKAAQPATPAKPSTTPRDGQSSQS